MSASKKAIDNADVPAKYSLLDSFMTKAELRELLGSTPGEPPQHVKREQKAPPMPPSMEGHRRGNRRQS